MAKPSSRRTSRNTSPLAASAPEVIDPRWLLKVLGLVIAAAAVLAYLSLCFLIYQGAWQLLLQPSSKVARTPAALAIPFDAVRFDAGATGRPRLSAWWIPAQTPAAAAATLLYLHDGKGSLADTVDQLAALHRAGVNILALDYRGFGASDAAHPSQSRMSEDANAALDYLTETRHLAPTSILPYGVGLGAALAAALAVSHPELPALIVDNPDPDAAARVLEDNRSRFMPVRLLIRDRFDLAAPLRQFRGPKLLLVGGPGDLHPNVDARTGVFFRSLPDPKYIVTLPPGVSAQNQNAAPDSEPYVEAVRRFVDEAAPVR